MGSRMPHVKGQFLEERTCQGMLDNTAMSCAKIAEPIEFPFGLWTSMGPRKYVLHASANWRCLGDTIEPSVCNSDAAAFLSNYFNHLLLRPPCVADADIILLPCGFYLSFFPCLISALADWMSTILRHMMWP